MDDRSTDGGVITAIEVQPHRSARVNVYVDGRFALAVDRTVASEAGLGVGRAVTAADLHALQAADEQARAKAAALRLLAIRPRSEHEIRQHLQRRGAAADVIDAVVDQLKQAGLLDDLAFTTAWVESRERLRPRSARLLARELRQKGIPRAMIATALAAIDEDASADRACAQKLRTLAALPEERFRRTLTAYLLRRGYDYDTASRAVERAWRACHS